MIESEWQNLHRSGIRPTSRNDLLSVLTSIDSILVRATLKDVTSKSSISDVYLDTAVPQQTAQGRIRGLELCRCPAGYKGTSCEVSFYLTFQWKYATKPIDHFTDL